MNEEKHVFGKKLCGCDHSVPYYGPLDRMEPIAECSGCGSKMNFAVLADYIVHIAKGNIPTFSHAERRGES